MRIGIVGLGLMGGSLALDIKKKEFAKEILGFDRNLIHQKEALELGLVDRVVEFDVIKGCDVIFLAIPVEGIIATLQNLQDISKETTIIDLGSTKAKIVSSCPPSIRAQFVATHPMTGTEYSGPLAAIEGLYEGKIVVFCNTQDNAIKHLKRAQMLYEGIGMQIVYMDATDHDRHAAFISHLPHAISYALANTVLKQEDPKSILVLAAGGFKDMSRLAKSNPTMWSDIFKQNRDNLLESITAFKKELQRVQKLIETQKWEELQKWMEEATRLHQIL